MTNDELLARLEALENRVRALENHRRAVADHEKKSAELEAWKKITPGMEGWSAGPKPP